MELSKIQADLRHEDFQFRLKAVQALHHYPSDVAVPILLDQLIDREFLVRTFIAMALAKHPRSPPCIEGTAKMPTSTPRAWNMVGGSVMSATQASTY